MTNATEYAPEVVRGAKRLQRAFYKRKLGPWSNVVTPWRFLTDAERAEFLRVAALFHAADYLHDGNADAVVAEVARELRPKVPDDYPADKLTAYVTARYAEYTNPYLDKD
jgi:hypothetical protein